MPIVDSCSATTILRCPDRICRKQAARPELGPSRELLDDLHGKRVVICVGSGGVGKTTVSAALALGLASQAARSRS